MRGLLESIRYTLRVLLKSPGFTITAILILGLGIGANTAIFSFIDAVVLKPLPYPEPDRLVVIYQPSESDPSTWIDYPDYVDMAAAQHTFESLAVATRDSLDLSGSGEPEHLQADFVSPSMFKVSGTSAILGRVFAEQEDIPNGPLLAVLSEHYWKTRFHADPNIIGKNLTLSDHSFQVIGVVPTQVNDWGPPGTDVYAPANTIATLGFFPNDRGYPLALRDLHFFFCIGRLKTGVSIAQAQADLETIHDNLLNRYPDSNRGYGLRITPLLDSMVNGYAATTWILGAAVGCLLLIACANIANLLFARGLQRRRELMIRATLGATQRRIIGQLLLETFLLSVLGGILGVFIAFASIEAIKRLSPPDLYRFQQLSMDGPALLFIFGVVLMTSLLSGLLPAWSLSKVSLAPGLKDEAGRSGTTGQQRNRTQSGLVTGQVGIACVLLIAAGLLLRSFQAAQSIPSGFTPHHLLTAGIVLSSAKYETDGVRTRAFWDALMTKIGDLPGIVESAINNQPPQKYDWELLYAFTIDGQRDRGPGQQPVVTCQTVTTSYFRTLEIPVLQGRDFNSQDTIEKPRVIMIDAALADHYFPGQTALGKGISVQTQGGVRDCTIIGVVPHVRYKSAGQAENPYQAYFPYSQSDGDDGTLILRSDLDPAALIPAIRRVVSSIDPGVPIYGVSTYDDLIAQKLVARKQGTMLVTLFSGAALFLSIVGLYGILAYTVGQRTREIGIRIALGAQSDNILRLITAQGLKIVGVGLIVGLLASLILVRFIEGILYGVSATDPFSLCAAVIVLGLAALVACLFPALRATRINPITALRE
jgi:putative ABC transport system permease protein